MAVHPRQRRQRTVKILRLSLYNYARADDLDLVARARGVADQQAFGELVRRYQSQLRGFLLRLTRDAAEADDLAQDAFLHAWEKLSGFRADGSFPGWLMRVGWTTFLQARRRRDRYRDVVARAALEQPADGREEPGYALSDLDRLLAAMSEEERAVMILSYGCGMSHREISEVTDMPVGTVKSVIFRGKQRIRQEFEIEHHQTG